MREFTAEETQQAQELLARASRGEPLDIGMMLLLATIAPEATRGLRDGHRNLAAASLLGHALAARGWAPTARIPVEPFAELFERVDALDDDSSDEVVADIWERSGVFPRAFDKIEALGASIGPDFTTLYAERKHICEEAWHCQTAGNRRAAIALLLAQVDGICQDVHAGKQFFTNRQVQKLDVVDAVTFAGAERGLELARDYLSKPAPDTQISPRLSRHGVMHGRDLGFGTNVNLWKSAVLVISVVEWALQRVRWLHDERRRLADEQHAGSTAVDDRGVRADRRKFFEVRDALRRLTLAEMYAQRTDGRFLPIAELPSSFTADIEVDAVHVTADGTSWWAHTTSPSGLVFAISTDAEGRQLFWEGDIAPAHGPPGSGWSEYETPNWHGDVYSGSDDPLPFARKSSAEN